MEKMTMDDLTQAELDEGEPIEDELNALVREGFSEHSLAAFIKTVVEIRKAVPDATVEGVFEAALLVGLEAVRNSMSAEAPPTRKSVPKRRGKRGKPGSILVR